MARSTFYYHLSTLQIQDKWEDVKETILFIYNRHGGRYGYRRITQELLSEHQIKLNRKTVKRLMDDLGLKSMVRIKKYRSYTGTVGTIAPNILKRDFSTTDFNQKWVTDVTEFHLLGVKIYLSPIIELHNGEVLGYTIYDRPVLQMVLDMLKSTISAHPSCQGVILHSDQGFHYQHESYVKEISNLGIIQSMSRKGNCLDNACAESFFSQLKSEFLYLKTFDSVMQFKQELREYLKFYNKDRIKSKLGISPVQFRKMKEENKNVA
jgi:putative transposase